MMRQSVVTQVRRGLALLLCRIGIHGQPIGACDIALIDTEQRRTLKYRAYWICLRCERELHEMKGVRTYKIPAEKEFTVVPFDDRTIP